MTDDTETERYWHETVELTVGELLEALNKLPADAPIRIDVPPSPRSDEMRDSDDSGGDFVVSGVVLHDADYLPRIEVVLQADFSSEWYVRPVESDAEE